MDIDTVKASFRELLRAKEEEFSNAYKAIADLDIISALYGIRALCEDDSTPQADKDRLLKLQDELLQGMGDKQRKELVDHTTAMGNLIDIANAIFAKHGDASRPDETFEEVCKRAAKAGDPQAQAFFRPVS